MLSTIDKFMAEFDEIKTMFTNSFQLQPSEFATQIGDFDE